MLKLLDINFNQPFTFLVLRLCHYECQLKNCREPQALNEFLNYIENRFMAIQSATSKSKNQSNYSEQEKNSPSKKPQKTLSEKNVSCVFCASTTHFIYKCSDFEKKSVNDRMTWAKSKALCMNCFSGSHRTHECKSKHLCRICKKKHNSLLHIEQKSATKQINANSAGVAERINDEVQTINATVALNYKASNYYTQ